MSSLVLETAQYFCLQDTTRKKLSTGRKHAVHKNRRGTESELHGQSGRKRGEDLVNKKLGFDIDSLLRRCKDLNDQTSSMCMKAVMKLLNKNI